MVHGKPQGGYWPNDWVISVCIVEFMQKIISLVSAGDNLCALFELKLSLKLNPRLRYHKSSC